MCVDNMINDAELYDKIMKYIDETYILNRKEDSNK